MLPPRRRFLLLPPSSASLPLPAHQLLLYLLLGWLLMESVPPLPGLALPLPLLPSFWLELSGLLLLSNALFVSLPALQLLLQLVLFMHCLLPSLALAVLKLRLLQPQLLLELSPLWPAAGSS